MKGRPASAENDTVEMRAVRVDPAEAHAFRCNDRDEPPHQFRAARLLTEAVGVEDVVGVEV